MVCHARMSDPLRRYRHRRIPVSCVNRRRSAECAIQSDALSWLRSHWKKTLAMGGPLLILMLLSKAWAGLLDGRGLWSTLGGGGVVLDRLLDLEEEDDPLWFRLESELLPGQREVSFSWHRLGPEGMLSTSCSLREEEEVLFLAEGL